MFRWNPTYCGMCGHTIQTKANITSYVVQAVLHIATCYVSAFNFSAILKCTYKILKYITGSPVSALTNSFPSVGSNLQEFISAIDDSFDMDK